MHKLSNLYKFFCILSVKFKEFSFFFYHFGNKYQIPLIAQR